MSTPPNATFPLIYNVGAPSIFEDLSLSSTPPNVAFTLLTTFHPRGTKISAPPKETSRFKVAPSGARIALSR